MTESSSQAAPGTAPIFFICHLEAEKALSDALIGVLEACLTLPEDGIRCTSSPGYNAKRGNFSERLRRDISECKGFFALLTPESVKSSWVWMECGAAWGADPEKIDPVFASRDLLSAAPQPISGENAVLGDDADAGSDLLDFIREFAADHGLTFSNTGRVHARVNAFISALRNVNEAAPPIAQAPPHALPEYCQLSQLARDQRQRAPAGQQHGGEVLFHSHLNVRKNRKLRDVHTAVEEFFAVRDARIRDTVLWSLLGRMEIALTFRAPADIGGELQKNLEQHVRTHIGARKGEKAVDFRHYELATEFIWENNGYVPGHRSYDADFLRSDRNTHAIISLHYQGPPGAPHDTAIERLKNRLAPGKDDQGGDVHVDLYGLTPCGNSVILEMHLPCGQQECIRRLSRWLETELVYWNKETHFVYATTPLEIRAAAA